MKRFQHITVDQTKTLIANGNAAVVDIRDGLSYQRSHIAGATQLDNSNVATFLQNTPRQTPVVVYCYHGVSSQGVAQYLVEQGFEEVYSMDGGFAAWYE